ncbi:MAG: CBS domain-containing protein [Rhodopseudomonas palustris]|nr:CBS domain-containing protein [Rhodopseudomonas palustris]
MSAPAVTIEADAELLEIAGLLSANRIKRLPVMRNGKLAGIVGRADLVRAVVQSEADAITAAAQVSRNGDGWPVASARLEALTAPPAQPEPAAAATPRAGCRPPASTILSPIMNNSCCNSANRERLRAAQQPRKDAQDFLANQLTEEAWQQMLANARAACCCAARKRA